MLSSTMRIQGKGFLRSAISLLLSNKEEVKNEKEVKEVFALGESVLEGNKYVRSVYSISDIKLPISKQKLEDYVYSSLPFLTIENEKKFNEEINKSMDKLTEIHSSEKMRKKYEEQRQQSEETKSVEESKPIPQQLYYPEQNPSIPYPELNQQPQPQILPQAHPMYQEEEFDENADFTLQDIIDGRLVIRPTDSIEVARKKLALADGKTKRFADGIFNNQITNPQQNEVQVEEVNQNDSEYNRVKKIFDAFECKLDKDSTYEDKENYISERGMLYNSVYKDDSSKYLVEDKENVVMMGLQAICTIMGEDINNINCTSNKQLLSDLGRFLVENVNEENINRAIMCVNLFEGYVLVQIKDMNL